MKRPARTDLPERVQYTKYYEHDSRKIPFGTATWWRQLEMEGSGRRR